MRYDPHEAAVDVYRFWNERNGWAAPVDGAFRQIERGTPTPSVHAVLYETFGQ